jgi:nucleotide-binding universal stress UspA family protein
MTLETGQQLPVVAGIDGSSSSYAAADYAAWLAESKGVPLRLLHGYQRPSYSYDIIGLPHPEEVTGEQALAEVGEVLTQLAGQLKSAYPAIPGIEVAQENHSPAALLIEASKEASVTVVGCRGLGGFAELLLGSVSAQVAAHARGPVIVVRPPVVDVVIMRDAARVLPPRPRTGPVVAGYDGSPQADAAVGFAVAEALRRRVPLIVVNVFADATAAAEDLLIDAVRPWTARYPELDVELRTVHGLQPDQRLVEQSRESGLVVVGCRGRGGFAGVLLGSVSRTLVHHGMCPVAVIHTDGQEHHQ